MQADGVRRYQYNPRVLDVRRRRSARHRVRPHGLPLATNDATPMESAAAEYKRGVEIRRVRRAGGAVLSARRRAFHLLGDVATRRNWGAATRRTSSAMLQDGCAASTITPPRCR